MTKTKRISAAIATLATIVALSACSSTPEPQGVSATESYAPSVRVIDVGGKNATISAAAGDMLVLDPTSPEFDKNDWKVTVTPENAAAVANANVKARAKGAGIPLAPLVAFSGTDTVTITIKQKSTGFSQKITVKVASPAPAANQPESTESADPAK